MRTLEAAVITQSVRDMCMEANRTLPADVRRCIARAAAGESAPQAMEVFRQLRENMDLAASTGLSLCQDTGLAVFFVELGQNLHIEGSLTEAIHEGVRQGYAEGYLRKSTCHPFSRKNTGDNTPAVIHYDLVSGDSMRIAFMAKGGGAENMSRVTILAPSEGWEGVKAFVLQRVSESGANPCPPIIVGIGMGGTFERSALLSKKALLRELDDKNPVPDLAAKEAELLDRINKLGIGPMGLGGKTGCLAVKMLVEPCHIASLPLAVNIQCHSARHTEVLL